MSYLVLARKWRPTTFADVVGQAHVTRTLRNAIQLDRVAHALLFTGSRGIGKTTCARLLACALNCEDGPKVDPPADDPVCLEIMGGSSVDVFEIDGASNNSVDQIREIRESVKFLPTRGKRKIYIIDEVHMLSTSAFNALLKTLEEPPEHVLFVFATTEPHKIPDTIISRCQRFDFKRIPEGEIVGAIAKIAAAEGLTVEEAALHHIAREAQGGMRDSLSLLDQVIAFCGDNITEAQTREVLGIADRKVLYDLTTAVLVGDGKAALEIVDSLFRFGIDLQKFAAEFLGHLRDLIVVRVCPEAPHLVDLPASELETAGQQVADVAPARLHRLFNAMLGCAESVAESPFPKLVLEMSLLRLCEQGPTLPLAEVLDGLARLEARLDEELPPDGGGGHPPGPPAPRSPGPAPGGPMTSGGGGGPMLSAEPVTRAEPAAHAEPVARVEQVVHAEPVAHAEPAVRASPPQPPTLRVVNGGPSVVAESTTPRPTLRVVESDPEVPNAIDIAEVFDALPLPVSFELPPPDVDAPARPNLALAEPVTVQSVEPASIEPVEVETVARLALGDERPAVEHFEHVVMELRARDAFQASEIEQSVRMHRFDAQAMQIAIPAGSGDELRQALGHLEAVVEEAVGHNVPIEVVFCERGDERLAVETLYERKCRLVKEALEARRVAAAEDPKVKLAIEVLGAEIASVEPR